MGKLINGIWKEEAIVTSDEKGTYSRKERTFRNFITNDDRIFQPESQRYHLYVSYACPWAHRTLIVRKLKGLQSHVSVSVVHPDMLSFGWSFDKNYPGATGDHLFGYNYLYEIYQKVRSGLSSA